MTDRRVFMIDSDPKHDVSDARRFGSLQTLWGRHEPRPSVFSHAFVKETTSRMDELEYDPEVDYIVVTGNVVMNTVLITSLAMRDDTVNLLLYDSAMEEYVHKTFMRPVNASADDGTNQTE